MVTRRRGAFRRGTLLDSRTSLPQQVTSKRQPAMFSSTNVLREPVSKRDLTTREKILLLEGSKLHGSVFPPWKAAPEPAEFELPTGEAQYMYV